MYDTDGIGGIDLYALVEIAPPFEDSELNQSEGRVAEALYYNHDWNFSPVNRRPPMLLNPPDSACSIQSDGCAVSNPQPGSTAAPQQKWKDCRSKRHSPWHSPSSFSSGTLTVCRDQGNYLPVTDYKVRVDCALLHKLPKISFS